MQKLPNKTKFNKSHKIKIYKGSKSNTLSFFKSGIRTTNRSYITWNNFESFRKVYVRSFRSKEVKNKKNFKLIQSSKKKKKKKRLTLKKKVNSMIFKAHFFSPLTKKPLQVRMGKGKGSAYSWVFPCSSNRILIEQLTTIRKKKIKRVFSKASNKMPVGFSLEFDKRKQIFPHRLKNFFFTRRNYINFSTNEMKVNYLTNKLKIFKTNER
jgi:ribosomal protein L16/L10AE